MGWFVHFVELVDRVPELFLDVADTVGCKKVRQIDQCWLVCSRPASQPASQPQELIQVTNKMAGLSGTDQYVCIVAPWCLIRV